MNKPLFALAVSAALSTLSVSTTAHAQSAVTIYGIVDAGLVHERGGVAGSATRVSSGVGSASRLGFRGTEDLGGGLSANFVLELGARIDTGEIDSAGTIFNRQAYVGLKSTTLGALTLGRQYTPYYNALAGVADPFGAGYAGSAKNLFPTVGANTRTSNAVVYTSPKLAGVTAELSYALGEQAGSNKAGRQVGLGLGYSEGKLNARAVINHRNNDLTAAAGAAQTPAVPAQNRDNGRNALVAANYDFGPVKGYAAYGVDKGLNSAVLPNTGLPFGGVRATASTDSAEWLIGATAPIAGANTLVASYIRKNDKTFRNQDADQWAVGLQHALSKRTSAYVAYAKISNKNGAGYTVGNNTDIGTGDSAVNLGVRHTF